MRCAGTGRLVKPAAEPNDSGVVETVTRRRIVPAQDPQNAQTPDLWDYLRTIPAQEWAKHMVYVYRVEPPPAIALLKTANQYLPMPGGTQVSLSDEDEVQFAMSQHYGGGTYRIIVKKGAQWVTQGRFTLGGPYKAITIPIDTGTPTPGAPSVLPTGADSTAMIAGKAIDTIAGQEHQAVNLGLGMMTTAANVIKSFTDGRPGASNDLMQQFMAIAMQRMLTPPPDPLDILTKLFAVMQQLNPQRTQDETTTQIMKTALDRLLNPQPTGAPVNGAAELVRQLPAIGGQFVEGLKAFAQAREAEARIVAMQRGNGAPGVMSPQVILPAVPPSTQPAANPAPGAGPTMEFVEQKIIEILRQPISAEQAADDVMTFLQTLDAASLDKLAELGEGGIIALFNARPILKQATNNMPRLVEFVRNFLRMYAEDHAAEGQGTAAAKPPLPN